MPRERKQRRLLIVTDGEVWFVRRVAYNVDAMDDGEMIYHCDKHLGGPYTDYIKAVQRAHDVLHMPHSRAWR